MDMDKIPHRCVESIGFGVFGSKELKNLSVLEITNVKTFDVLGHPTNGGLYDPALGPSDRDELCTTCNLNQIHCPGHFGHIALPLPVFNPVFFRTLYQILKGSCFSCKGLLSPPAVLQLTLMQLKALDYGLIGLVQEFSELSTEIISSQTNSSVLQTALVVKEKLQQAMDEALKGLNVETLTHFTMVKNVLESRQRIVKTFLQEYLGKSDRKCPNCGAAKRQLNVHQNSRFIFGSSRSVKVPSKKEASRRQPQDDEFFEESLVNEENSIEEGKMEENTAVEMSSDQTFLTPLDAKKHLAKVWEKEKHLLSKLFGVLGLVDDSHELPVDIFFLDFVVVPPCRFRPLSVLKGKKYENQQSTSLNKVLFAAIAVAQLLKVMNNSSEASEAIQAIVNSLPGKTKSEKFHNAWNSLQVSVNTVVDSDLDKLNTDKISGVKQILEKKEGLFRKHMMGKRVNYAARSVISPDPYIMVDEIGIPIIFATKLTYPQPVTPWNVRQLRQAVINGPNVHPGAVLVQNEDGHIVKLNPAQRVQREAIAKQLLTPSQSYKKGQRGCKTVYRHLLNGDVLLLNRQPTLHKPSIMAHRARVLPGEKTLRLHYANCKSYNADFDGDEMNAHFPQSEFGRSEAYNIASVTNQYLVPKDGTPLSGLIQDHMISGVLLTMRGNFFSREDYQALIYGALTFIRKPIKLLPPSIRKPRVLWSGKQILSTVLINVIPEGRPPPSLEGKAKISSKTWQVEPARPWLAGGTPLKGDSMTESEVIIHNGELLCGVLDKAHYGPTAYGLVHCCYEFYGGKTSSLLLTSLARLFTHYLQQHLGFTLGIEDILVTAKANKKRWRVMKKARKCGNEIAAETLGVSNAENVSLLYSKLEAAHRKKDDYDLKQLDNSMKSRTDAINNEINKVCFPNGLIKTFPSNNLQLMVQSGSKGSTVNCMQISCLLGQIELEGRRVPLMMSGRTLPSFQPYDTSPRAGGFVDGRFLTGIRPQEYFFHCMAGREGLVDTAVKTSRSGYLQRCLIKHLEGIVVNYDLTVRDSDGSVIQFTYGEDGLDISKCQLLKEKVIPLMIRNHAAIVEEDKIEEVLQKLDSRDAPKAWKKIRKWKNRHGNVQNKQRMSGFMAYVSEHSDVFNDVYESKDPKASFTNAKRQLESDWYNLDEEIKKKYNKKGLPCSDPIMGAHRPDLYFGSLSEKLNEIVSDYIEKNPDNLLDSEEPANNRTYVSSMKKLLPVNDFKNMMYYRNLRSLCDPGEAVGLLAAQSIGEPSTQMTLNTFHFAGRGEMNVTLGIPRLREILMAASQNIATPSMDLPLLADAKDVEERAEKLRLKLNTVLLSQVLESIDVTESITTSGSGFHRLYRAKFCFLPQKTYKKKFQVNPTKILFFMEKIFFKKMIIALKRRINANKTMLISTGKMRSNKTEAAGEQLPEFLDAVNADTSEDEDDDDGDMTSSKQKMRHSQETEYEEPEDGEAAVYQSDNEESYANDEESYHESSSNKNARFDIKEQVQEDGEEGNLDSLSSSFLSSKKFKKKRKISEKEEHKRVGFVTKNNPWITDYTFDTKKQRWCEIILQLNVEGTKLDMMSFLEEESAKTVIHEIKGIKKAFLVKDHKSLGEFGKMIKTEGVNLLEMFKYEDLLDVNRIYSNDIHSIAKTYGIEAASRAIYQEVKNVFAAYAIEVDPRHLFLIADYMTSDGSFKACNRIAMENNASPLQQMTFETTMHFLRSSTLSGFQDNLKSPSSKIILGQVVQGGTGCMDILLPRGNAKVK